MSLAGIVSFSVRRRGVVLVVWLLVAAAAALGLKKLSVDAVPDVTNTQVLILTTAPGLSPEEVEQYLTFPVETAMNGLPGLSQIRSVSRTALSAVTVVFDDDTDVWFARQLVNERLKQAEADIPEGYGRPELAPVSTGLGQIFEFYLRSPRHSAMELRTMLDWIVAPRLRAVPGVIEVNALGGEVRQFQVVVDPKRLAGHRLSLSQVHAILMNNNAALGGGYLERNGEALVIRGNGQFRSLEDIANTVITSDADGTPVLLKNVAKVQIGPALPFGAATKHGEGEIVTGTAMMLIGANSREVVEGVKHRLEVVKAMLPSGVEIIPFYDRAEFINRMLKTVVINLGEGAALVVVVLFLTLGSLRGSLIAALAIPLAMGIAVIGMLRLGVTGNLMSLGAIDFGLLVDGAIVMLEGALLQLALRQPRARTDTVEAIATAMRKAARPITFSLLIILMVYLPLMALEGVEGHMFKPMAITVALALGGALAFSLTAFPALAAFVLKAPKHAHDPNKGVFGFLRRVYGPVVRFTLRRPAWTMGGALVLLVGAGLFGTKLGAEFVPRLEEGELALDVRRLPSISLHEAKRLGQQLENVLARFPEVTSVVSRTGRAEVATDPVGFDEADVRVKLRPKEEWTTAHDLDDLGEALKRAIEAEVPGTFIGISQPIEDRVNQLLAGSKADVVVKLFGADLEVLKDTADKMAKVLREVPGNADLRVQRVLGLPLLDVKPDRARLARYGLSADDVLDVVEASRVGRAAGTIFEGPRRFDLRLFLPPLSLTTEGLGELTVTGDRGQLVPLAAVADLKEIEGPSVIHRENLQRRVLVEVNVRGRDLVSFVNEARQRVEQAVSLPKGVTVAWGGQFANFARASERLGLVVPVALGIIFGMLFFMFGQMRYAVAVFASAPFALIGGVLALAARGLPFSIPAAVGFIAVAGVAVLNGVVLASELRALLEGGAAPEGPENLPHGSETAQGDDAPPSQDAVPPHPHETIVASALSALRPVLTTALVAAVGFLPMAFSSRAGAEVQRPLATVVMGGIASSTLIGLLVLPVLLWLLVGRRHARQVEASSRVRAPRGQPSVMLAP
jgi:cobalt-zinc-cadmium resistance protein CzcA